MTSWNGEFVTNELRLPTPAVDGFKELLGMALRKNKKRAHLLVSSVLGKHVPQRPHIISCAAETLAKQVQNPDDSVELVADFLDVLAGKKKHLKPGKDSGSRSEVFTVFGYAETATSLGASVAYHLGADYIHSTRYPVNGSVEYGGFDESHSHATAHHITPSDVMILDDVDREIVLVDDELTTGNTIMNTIRLFESRAHHAQYHVATLTDLRTDAALQVFREFETELGIKVHVVALLATELPVPADSVATAEPVIEKMKNHPEATSQASGDAAVKRFDVTPVNLSQGVTHSQLNELTVVAAELAEHVCINRDEKVLFLGLEEDMFFPLLVAQELESWGFNVWSSSATRSPVVAYDVEGYAVRDRVRYIVADDESPRFAYNIGHDFDRIILITAGLEGTERVEELIAELKTRTKVVEIMETKVNVKNLQAPLYGPAFGSYPAKDVAWLLKDLSHAELEAPTEEREEAIQNGGAHYAESLPVEYQPTEEYQQIFLESLEAKKYELALSVGILAEQIFKRREGTPVLVSLARAGTPVGVLLKRYLDKAFNVDVPHYAVSIVRGRGIDFNAMNYIAAHHDAKDVVFVDGWSGKGKITKELTAALDVYESQTGVHFSSELAVISDPAHCTDLYGTRDDFLIPSATLNSTVSGLVSRTVLNDAYIGADDYHGAKFYEELAEKDYSNLFVDSVTELFTEKNIALAAAAAEKHVPEAVDWSGWKTVERISKEYGVEDLNLIKPGGAETTRVLLRRVPELILIRPDKYDELKHIVILAENRGARIELVEDLPYASVGIIKPLQKGEKE